MALYCRLLKTSKKPNSTSTSYTLVTNVVVTALKDNCDILNPVLEFKTSPANMEYWTGNVNYCQFLERYYYIDRWEFDGGILRAYCGVDVLATYREAIGNSEQFLLRAANGYRLNITDTLFPAKTTPDIVRTNCSDMSYSNGNSFWATNLKSGTYVLGVLNGETSSVGSVCYYALTYSEFDALRQALMSGDDWFMDGVDDVSVGVMKALVNPMQYITVCYWLPMDLPYLEESGVVKTRTAADPNIHFGFWDSGVYGWSFKSIEAVNSGAIEMPTHPDGYTFHNYAPYSRYYLYLPPVGYVALDRNLISNSVEGKIWVVCNIDIPTGKALWWIDGYPQKWECQIGVPIHLSMANADYLGMAQAAVSTIGGVATSLSRLDVGGAIQNGMSGVISAIDASLPQISSSGGNGCLSGVTHDTPHLITVQFRESDVDVARFGRPCCHTAKINESEGYKLCANATIEIPGALKPEVDEIVEHLNRGFYYE